MIPAPTKEKFQAVFLAIMFGDAMGQAVETMSRAEIKKATDGKGISFFSKPLQTKIAENRDLAAGQTTDDWQLTKLVAESLIACSGYSQEDVARRHTDLFNEHLAACGFGPDDQDMAEWLKAKPIRQTELAGWGGTTKRAVADLHLGFVTDFKQGRHFDTPAPSYGKNMGAGNGVAMKVAPLVLWHWAYGTEQSGLAHDIYQLGMLTHCHPDAFLATDYYANALAFILGHEEYAKAPFGSGNHFIDSIHSGPRWFLPEIDTSQSKAYECLKKLLDVSNTDPELFKDTYKIVKPNFNAAESVAYAIGNFLGYGNDTKATILHAVNDGGDADSTAALSGALAAAQNGLDSLPMSWYAFWPDLYSEALEVGAALAVSCGIQD